MVSNRPLKVAIYTFGCKVNLFESDQLKKSLKNVEFVSHEEKADIFIINGCTVTSSADSQVRNMIRRFAKKGEVIVTGCYARKADSCLENIDNVKFISDLNDVAQYFGDFLQFDAFFERSRPFLKIQSGCDQFCSYCIIPFVRGPLKSVPLDEIKQLIEKIKLNGFKEVVLTGIHIGKYGRDLKDDSTLADVVKAAYEIIGRVRLGSLESPEVDDRLYEYAKAKMILPHWHIPLQHGSDTVLQRMNRPYTAQNFKNVIERILINTGKLTAIGTDVITGFPQETEKEFLESYNFIKSIPFTYGHVFPFSARKGTAAYKMEKENPVKSEIKKERAAILRDLFNEKKIQFMKHLNGIYDDVIIEEEIGNNLFNSTSSMFQTVRVSGNYKPKDLVNVKMKHLNGELIGK